MSFTALAIRQRFIPNPTDERLSKMKLFRMMSVAFGAIVGSAAVLIAGTPSVGGAATYPLQPLPPQPVTTVSAPGGTSSLPVTADVDLQGGSTVASGSFGSNASGVATFPAGTFTTGQQVVLADASSVTPPAGSNAVLTLFFGVYNSDGTKMTGTFANPVTLTIDSSSIGPNDTVEIYSGGAWHSVTASAQGGQVVITITSDPVILISSPTSSKPTSPSGTASSGSPSSSGSTSPASSTTVSSTTPLLVYGSTGASVKAIQKALNASGAKLTVDGIFGPLTEAAVKSFQAKHHLTADGIVGIQTWKALGV
jgi:hypothetical protein